LAAASHSAGGATPRAVRDALFAQAGVLAVDEITELPGLLALLCRQPLPAGPRVAVLSNAGGAGVLAADACVRAGLQIAVPETGTRAALTALLPGAAAVADPVDTTATCPQPSSVARWSCCCPIPVSTPCSLSARLRAPVILCRVSDRSWRPDPASPLPPSAWDRPRP
jgi:hypothetical protein